MYIYIGSTLQCSNPWMLEKRFRDGMCALLRGCDAARAALYHYYHHHHHHHCTSTIYIVRLTHTHSHANPVAVTLC